MARADWLIGGVAPLPYMGTRPRIGPHWLTDGIARLPHMGKKTVLLIDWPVADLLLFLFGLLNLCTFDIFIINTMKLSYYGDNSRIS